MAIKKDDTGRAAEGAESEEEDEPQPDPVAIIQQAVNDAMDGWWKKNRPAPNRTSQPDDTGIMATLFGKGYRR